MDDTLLLEFIKSIQGVIQPSEVRATPHGLFIPTAKVSLIVDSYHQWLNAKGLPNSTELKSKKRLFGDEQPPEFILNEGKHVLKGTLINCKIEQPQQLGIPYFLGTLDDARKIVSAEDPILQKLSEVNVQNTPAGLKIEIKLKDKTIYVSANVFERFTKIRGTALAKVEQISFLVSLLRSAKKYREGSPLLVPFMLRGNKTVTILCNRSLTFIINARNELTYIYDTHPRNIEGFLREDYEDILNRNSQTIGALMVPFRNDKKSIGKIKSRGKDIQISWKGFTSLAAKIAEHPPFEPQFQGRFTLIQCLEKLLQQFRGSAHHGSHQRVSS